jgi:hypothetical protein
MKSSKGKQVQHSSSLVKQKKVYPFKIAGSLIKNKAQFKYYSLTPFGPVMS